MVFRYILGKVPVVTALFLLETVVVCPLRAQAPMQRPAWRYTMSEFLHDLGTRADCYFTVEMNAPLQRGKVPVSSLYTPPSYDPAEMTVRAPADVTTLLKRVLPDDFVWRDALVPVVIHIEDHILRSVPGYLMDRTCSLGYFSGSLHELGGRVGAMTGSVLHYPEPTLPLLGVDEDWTDRVRIPRLMGTVREILTESVPLSAYERVLWTCVWHDRHGAPAATLRQGGQRRPGWWIGTAGSGPRRPFSEGEAAYYLNPNDAADRQEALRFLRQRMKEPDHWQVRWTMLYLGRYHVQGAIPDLIHYIDYRYTWSPIATEMYPAYSALLQEGKPAVGPVFAAIRTESNPLRLSLLIRIVLTTDGVEHGRQEIGRECEAARRNQRDRIHEALVSAISGADGFSGHVLSKRI